MFLLRLAAALAAQDPPVTLVLDDLHLVTDPAVLNGLDFLLRNVGPGLRCWSPHGRIRCCRCTATGWPASWPRSGPATWPSTSPKPASSWPSTAMRCPRDSLECLTRRTEGWAAGLRLAAISMGTHPDPDQFVKELITEDSALTSYLVEEVLNAQPPEARELLLSTPSWRMSAPKPPAN